MISLAESEPGVSVAPDQLDANPWLLNCANGTLDLRTGELRPHRREDLLTKQVPVKYSPDARCQRWLDFLLEIMGGNLRLVAFLQRAVGYSLTGDVGEQVFFLLHGGGANGKSTFLESIKTMMGDYGAQADFGMFLSRRHESIPNDVARLAGARFVSALEAEAGKHLSESLVKSLTGGDTVAARFLYSEFFEYRPQFKLFLAANHKPVIKGTDLAIWRRIRLIPFAVTIPCEKQDKNLSAKLRSELPGILTWAVHGCMAWREHGLDVPGEVTAATESYRSEMDILGSFLAESCVQRPTSTATAKQLYFAYVQWCEGNGEHPLGQRNFGMRLSERGFDRRRGTGNVHIWHGIGLKTELGAFPELEE
jgi:putative DNA primase/helicase